MYVSRTGISTHASLAGRDRTEPLPLPLNSRHFNPRVPCGTRLYRGHIGHELDAFQPTRPLRDATGAFDTYVSDDYISTHASLAGRDPRKKGKNLGISEFQPTRPLRDATATSACTFSCTKISTHASLAGRDTACIIILAIRSDFNPRVPCGTRPATAAAPVIRCHFNPRVPCGTRLDRAVQLKMILHFNPRVPCGTRPARTAAALSQHLFQPTRPLRDATLATYSTAIGNSEFQPTRPLRDATSEYYNPSWRNFISTHASLAGRDAIWNVTGTYEGISTHASLAGRDVC